MARIYPNRNFTIREKFYWNNGANYITVATSALVERRLSANNPKPYVAEGSTADIFRHRTFIYPRPIKNSVTGAFVGWSAPSPPGYTLPTLGDSDFKLMRDNTVSTVFNKVKDFKNNANLLNFYGERKRTIDMVSKRLDQAYQLLRAARKPLTTLEKRVRRRPNSMSLQKRLANLRLEYAYGWKPLMSDLRQVCKELHEPPHYITVKSGRRSYFLDQQVSGVTYKTRIRDNFYKSVFAKLVLELDAPFVASASSLGLENPALLAWELTPYSFVVDWFLPIGSYLENLSALNGFKIKTSGLTLKTAGDRTLSNDYGASSYSSFKHTTRIGLDLSIPFPSFINPLSVDHALNALALIAQLKKDK